MAILLRLGIERILVFAPRRTEVETSVSREKRTIVRFGDCLTAFWPVAADPKAAARLRAP